MRTDLRTSLGAAIAVFAAATLEAQSNSGDVHGRAVDELGAAIANGTVTLVGPAGPRVTKLDAQGVFRFFRVSPGTYALSIAASGFTTVTREGVVVSAGRNTPIDVLLPLERVEQDVRVTGETPLADPRKVATGQNFSREALTEVPTGRDVWSLIQQVPGVQLDTVNVAGNASAVIGGPSLINRGSGNVTYAVDGATITDNTYGFGLNRQNGGTSTFFDFATIEDVEVVTGGSALEQQTSGVTVNVVTRRGTNALKGSARFLYASDDWQWDNTPESMSAEGLSTNSTRFIREYGAEVGGPIVQERLWLWASGARQDISLNPTTFSPSEIRRPETTRLEPWSAKLNAQVSSANALSAYYLRSDRFAAGLEAAPDRPSETRKNLDIPSDFYKIEDSHVFSSNLFAAIFASYLEPESESTPIGGLDRDMQFYGGSFHNSYEYLRSRSPQKQANLQASRFFDAGATSHELKFGFNYRQLNVLSSSGFPGSQNFGHGDFHEAWLSRAALRRYRAEYWTGTLGDVLSAGRLTVAAGVRFDLQRARNLPSSSPANAMFGEPCPVAACAPGGFPGLPELRYHGSEGWTIDFADWQPRISATYAPGKDSSTLMRASWARYADQLGWLAGFFGGIAGYNGYIYPWNDLNLDHDVQANELEWDEEPGWIFGVDPASLPFPPNRIAPDFRLASSDEITVGVDQQLEVDLAVSGTFTYRNTSDLQFLLPNGAGPTTWTYGGQATGTAEADGFTLTFDVPFFDLNLPEVPSGEEVVNRPGATQKYFGVDFTLVKRLSRRWAVRANVGWSRFRQYVTAQSIQNPNNLWSAGGQNDDGGIATGVSSKTNVWLNSGWQFNLHGVYQGPWDLTFGLNLYGRQGYPRPYRVNVITDDAADSVWGLLIDRMDTYRYPDVYQLDLRLQKTFAIGPLTLTPAVEVFNVANSSALLNSVPLAGWYDARADFQGGDRFEQDPSFNQTIEIQSPRIVRLGVQVSF